MKEKHIIAIIKSMDMDELTSWLNSLNPNGICRCKFVHRSETELLKKVFRQFIKDNEENPAKIVEAIPNIGKDYIFYDYDAKSLVSFNTQKEIFHYFDMDVIIDSFEDLTYEEIFGDSFEKNLEN